MALALIAGTLTCASTGHAAAEVGSDPVFDAPSASAGADPSDTPESLALAEARKAGREVSVDALIDANTDVVAQPDGTVVTTVHTQPVRVRKAGHWHTIDTSLHVASDGGVAPEAVISGLEFSGGGTQPLVRMSSAGKQLVISWPNALPKPIIDGNVAEYRSVLPDVDLRMTATLDGFTQTLVVKTAAAAQNPDLAKLTMGLSSPDLTLQKQADGSLAALDNVGGGTIFVAPKPMMFDSSASVQEGPGDGQSTGAVATSQTSAMGADSAVPSAEPDAHAAPVDVDISADQRSLTLTPDQGLLTSPSTVYPVMIDPNMTTPHAGGWVGISRANPSTPYWKFSYDGSYVPDFGVGYCASPNCSASDVKRVLYALPVHGQQFNGKHVLWAEFDAPETWAYNCTKQPVQLYATGKISSGTTWNNSSSTSGSSPFWAQNLQTVSDAKGWNGCAAGRVEFGGDLSTAVKNKVQEAANGNWTNVTFGLKAEDETAAGQWKRFGGDATLQVKYNLPPTQIKMSDMSMSPGSACQLDPVAINKWPQVTARAYDPDKEQIGVQFAVAWDSGDGGGFKRRWWSTGYEGTVPNLLKASGSQFSILLPSAKIPGNTGKSLGWEARAWDGAEWGPWSSSGTAPTDCYFKIDTSAPPGPTVSSPSFPGSTDFSDTLPWTDGVGQYATFSFLSTSKDPANPDKLTYQYNEDVTASPAHTVAPAAGTAGVVHVLQQKEGLHFFSVRAIDQAGNASTPTTFYFNVRAGQPERANWSMDDAPGTNTLGGGGGAYPLTLAGTAAGGVQGHAGTALNLPGTVDAAGVPQDYAATDGAVLDTSSSFTVSAWVNVSDITRSQAAVTQDGSYVGGFSLGLYQGKWTFKAPTQDGLGYLWQSAASSEPVVAGQWTHLVGVYSQTAQSMSIYVNGRASSPVSATSIWNARGPLELGRYRWQGTYTDAWTGAVDDVEVWDRGLSASDAAAATPPNEGIPAKSEWSLDETGSTMQGVPEANDASASGDVTTGVDGVAGKAARFGPTGYARTVRPQVNGARSFSVSAWVKLAPPAAGDTTSRVAVTQNGQHTYEFALYYSPSYKGWIFGRNQSDISTDTLVRAVQPNCTVGQPDSNGVPCMGPTTGEWTHLVGVADATAKRIQLFINGYLVSTVPYTQTSPWASPGSLQIGADNREGVNGEFFGGDIDDVRVFDRPVTSREIQDMIQQRPLLAARWKFNAATGSGPATAADDLGRHPATLYGPAAIDVDDVHVGSGSLSLDGTAQSYAATASPPVHTGESFTIAGWAQTAGGAPDHDETVWSIGDGTNSAVTLRWDYLRTDSDGTFVGQWQLEAVDTSTPAVHTRVEHTYTASDDWGSYWNHLAVTYDAFSNQLSLYVDGQLEDQVCDKEDTSGTCTQHTSFSGAKQPFEATGGLQFGHNRTAGNWTEPFNGQIDDVWVYQGVLSPAQIIELAGGDELDSTTGP